MNNKPIMAMLCGLPASGKSTYAKKLAEKYNAIILSSDKLREELFDNVNCQDKNNELFTTLHRRIKELLRDGKNVVYDATNINSKKRRAFLNELNKIDCVKECHIMATPYEECLKRNTIRDRLVPEEVIKRMYLNWNTPYWFEGWDDIIIHCDIKPVTTPDDWINRHLDYNQDNPYHIFSLGYHCCCTFAAILREMVDNYEAGDKFKSELAYAAGIHDCGKPFTKSFVNSKGEATEVAHYYNHNNCGAYDSLFFKYDSDTDCLTVSTLVNLHMMPYQWERDEVNGEKTRLKYKNLWGDKLYENVMKLHEADKSSHSYWEE